MIFRVIFYAVLFYAIYYALKGFFGGISRRIDGARSGDGGATGDEMVVCPECGTYFPSEFGVNRRVRWERFRFCGEECAEKFSLRGARPGKGEQGKGSN